MLNRLMFNKDRGASLKADESGIASLLVVSILAVVLALVSIGFSRLMDRELRQALDRELSAQAFYAAQAGLDDARAYLAAGGVGFSGCTNWPLTPVNGSQYFVSDLSGGQKAAKYSCISIDTNPNELIYTIKAGQSVTVELRQPNMANLYFGWENQSYANGPRPLGNLGVLPQETPSALPTDATGVLRVGLYPVANGLTSTTNGDLSALSRAYFMYPNAGSGTPGTVSYSSNGGFVAGNCKSPNTNPVNNSQASPRYCNSYISGLQGSSTNYFVTLTAEYQPLIVTVQSTNGGGNNPQSFGNVQAVVDVTGQGTDVLQRIRARIDLSNAHQAPDYGIQSMEALCKGFRAYVIGLGTYGDTYIDPGIPNNDGACVPGGGNAQVTPGGLGPH